LLSLLQQLRSGIGTKREYCDVGFKRRLRRISGHAAFSVGCKVEMFPN
jgi:hypothetical protein